MREGVIIALAIVTVIAAFLLTILASRSRVGWRDRDFWYNPPDTKNWIGGPDPFTWAGSIVMWLVSFFIVGGVILLAIHFNWYGLGN